jgi:hypothetical protein
MRTCLVLALTLCLLSLPALAATKAELFGGYQYTHLDPSFNLNGWNAAATIDLKGWLGGTADFSGTYRSGLKFHTYAFGPELRANLPLIKPFVHGLVGGATASGGGVRDTGFVALIGGGLDVGGGPIAFRLTQVDWVSTRFGGVTNNSRKNLRAAAGLVIRF